MTLFQRRLFMLFFVALFLLTAPLVIFMARGYHFDRLSGVFVHSGAVTIKSLPRDINIYINGKKQDKGSLSLINGAYTINWLRPGKYTIRCEKEGYTSWEKTISVHSGISTEFWNVLLFPKAEQELKSYVTENVKSFFVSPREEGEIIFLSEEENTRKVFLLNTQERIVREIYATQELEFLPPDKEENIEWSSDNQRILIPFWQPKTQTREYVLARVKREGLRDFLSLSQLLNQGQLELPNSPLQSSPESPRDSSEIASEPDSQSEIETPLSPEKSPLEIKQARWMFDENKELVILTTDHQLYYLNIENPQEKILLAEEVSGFDFAGDRIYYSQLPNNIVWEIKRNDVGSKEQITTTPIEAPSSGFLKIITYDQYRIALLNSQEDLFVFNNEKETGEISMEKTASGVKGIQFSNDGKKLLYWTDNEIWTLMLRDWEVQPIREKGQKLFLTRFSTPLHNVQWLDNYEHVLFSTGQEVKVVSLDLRGQAIIMDATQGEWNFPEKSIIYDKESQLLYFQDIKQVAQDSSPDESENSLQLKSMLLIDRPAFLLGF